MRVALGREIAFPVQVVCHSPCPHDGISRRFCLVEGRGDQDPFAAGQGRLPPRYPLNASTSAPLSSHTPSSEQPTDAPRPQHRDIRSNLVRTKPSRTCNETPSLTARLDQEFMSALGKQRVPVGLEHESDEYRLTGNFSLQPSAAAKVDDRVRRRERRRYTGQHRSASDLCSIASRSDDEHGHAHSICPGLSHGISALNAESDRFT